MRLRENLRAGDTIVSPGSTVNAL